MSTLPLTLNIRCLCWGGLAVTLLVMHPVIEALVELQKIEFGSDPESPSAKATAERLRGRVPSPILAHYDRLRARGKKGLALVRNRVCVECHMSVPIGTVITVAKGLDIQLCGNCGRYLYVEEDAITPAPASTTTPKAKPDRKPRKKPEMSDRDPTILEDSTPGHFTWQGLRTTRS